MKRISWVHLLKDLSSILNHLEGGSVFVCTTDTVIGLLAKACQSGIARVNSIKKRSESQPPIILVANKQQALEWAIVNSESVADRYMDFWPAPLTLILPLRPEKKHLLGINQDSVALRVPNHQGLLALLAHCNGLISTSANMHGNPIPTQFSELDTEIMQSCVYAISDVMDDNYQYPVIPSTIIDCTKSVPVVMRQGAFVLNQ